MARICKTCRGELVTVSMAQRHCDKCRFIVCPMCEKSFLTKPSAKNRQIYCCRGCRTKDQQGKFPEGVHELGTLYRMTHKGGKEIACSFCGTKTYKYPRYMQKTYKVIFCNQRCFVKWARTSDNPKWRGDDYPENRRLRQSLRAKKWAMAVKERDDYTCQKCSFRGSGLHADHIKSWAMYPELRFDLSNGQTLCVDCHRKTNTWGIKAKFQSVYA